MCSQGRDWLHFVAPPRATRASAGPAKSCSCDAHARRSSAVSQGATEFERARARPLKLTEQAVQSASPQVSRWTCLRELSMLVVARGRRRAAAHPARRPRGGRALLGLDARRARSPGVPAQRVVHYVKPENLLLQRRADGNAHGAADARATTSSSPTLGSREHARPPGGARREGAAEDLVLGCPERARGAGGGARLSEPALQPSARGDTWAFGMTWTRRLSARRCRRATRGRLRHLLVRAVDLVRKRPRPTGWKSCLHAPRRSARATNAAALVEWMASREEDEGERLAQHMLSQSPQPVAAVMQSCSWLYAERRRDGLGAVDAASIAKTSRDQGVARCELWRRLVRVLRAQYCSVAASRLHELLVRDRPLLAHAGRPRLGDAPEGLLGLDLAAAQAHARKLHAAVPGAPCARGP